MNECGDELEEWQLHFIVKGIIAQEEDIHLNDALLFRGGKDEEAHVFFRITVEADEKEKMHDEISQKSYQAQNLLRNILRVYALETGRWAEILPGYAASRIQPDNPFGKPHRAMAGRLRALISPEEMKRYTDSLNRVLRDFDEWSSVFSDEKKTFLMNALEYLYHATGEERLEAKLIDLMVAMESLFGGDQELRLRISLRAAYLLASGKAGERSWIFRLIYELYDRRSRIVHGGEKVHLEYEDVYDLERFLRQSIILLTPLNLSKKEIIAFLDESIYDEKRKEQLDALISKTQIARA